MRDRLIELIKQGARGHTFMPTEGIADHLLANGVIVLPCKVGDTVYEIIAKCSAPWNYCAYNGGYGTSRCGKNPCEAYIKESKFALSDLENVGKTVFLTREQAEKALAEVANGT
jgi:hypothetical protein